MIRLGAVCSYVARLFASVARSDRGAFSGEPAGFEVENFGLELSISAGELIEICCLTQTRGTVDTGQ
jgi:hypothetical protein